jgi:hypothetical protein
VAWPAFLVPISPVFASENEPDPIFHFSHRIALSSQFDANQVEQVKPTIVGLVTPHFLRVIDLAKQAETGVNVDWHLQDAVARTIDDLGHQYNARDLISAYILGLETAAHEAERVGKANASVLHAAVAIAKKRSVNIF